MLKLVRSYRTNTEYQPLGRLLPRLFPETFPVVLGPFDGLGFEEAGFGADLLPEALVMIFPYFM
ncbi:MAG: hypothetical protein ACI88H_000650 [Cocleimonas sp.]